MIFLRILRKTTLNVVNFVKLQNILAFFPFSSLSLFSGITPNSYRNNFAHLEWEWIGEYSSKNAQIYTNTIFFEKQRWHSIIIDQLDKAEQASN